MSRRFFFIVFFLTLMLEGNCQKKFTVIYKYHQSQEAKDSFGFSLLKPLGEFGGFFGENPFYNQVILSYKKNGDECTTVYQYEVKDSTCAVFLDLFGHETFVIPDDTVQVNLVKKEEEASKQFSASKFHFIYSGSNRFIYSLFDSLEYAYGDLRFNRANTSFDKTIDNYNKFYNEVTQVYNQRKKFIEKYSYIHSIPNVFFRMALSEIYSAYFLDLSSLVFNPEFNKSNLSKVYSAKLGATIFNKSDLYFNTVLYNLAAYPYWVYSANKDSMIQFSENSGLAKTYNIIKRNLKGNLRDHLLLHFLESNIYKKFRVSDSLQNDYSLFSQNNAYIRHIQGIAEKLREKEIKSEDLDFDKAFISRIKDEGGNEFELNKLLEDKKPTIIDCWASWCAPCLREIPSSLILEKKYKEKIKFLYLSFDKDTTSWLKKLKSIDLPKGNSYILVKNFESMFALYFKINSIPRYLIMDRNGKVFNVNAPRPSKPELKKILDKLLAN